MPEVSSSARIGSCIARPGKFIAIGLNYSDHAAETGAEIPKEPIVFNKASNCIVGPNDNIILPRASKKLDWEVEIAFVVGKNTKYITEKEAPSHIVGYCMVNDMMKLLFLRVRTRANLGTLLVRQVLTLLHTMKFLIHKTYQCISI